MVQTREKLSAVVFDWAGTIVDFGSCAPMGAFVELFAQFGIRLTVAQARGPMGMAKWEHIQALLLLPEVASQWQTVYGKQPDKMDVDHLYEVFVPLNAQVISDYADIVPGAIDVVQRLRERGLKIGSTTGYNWIIMDILSPLAAEKGYVPDNVVCAGDLPAGRPAPFMMYQTFAELGIWYPQTVVKVDDTGVGIQEGLNAGTWTVGITVSGNEVGLSLHEWQALSPAEQETLRARASAKLKAVGAHYVVDTVADLEPVLDEIQARILQGEKPV
ncbi:Phosphonoacetaldehyde hydrolase [Saezia sanguinis]|uniref:Phosphonoacetaldehyde hydrolase n=1 Tax=Saezia sanguinis TaxID=1965230 RepID=A0A433SFH1_9BURK|nr:phosphonoacetaldehyde hydrolase [Saezia sanguinis]RUS67470.1 Phosphonoacetaldehyde hydrolase [Saezia sanguinis]